MIDVLLLVPPGKKEFIRDVQYGCWHEKKWVDYSWPPLNLYQINAVIDNKFLSKLIDAPAEKLDFDAIIDRILKLKPKFLFVSVGAFTFNDDLLFLKEVKKALNSIKIIIYGEYPTTSPKICLKEDCIDYVIRGEPEVVINKLLEKHPNKKELKSVIGLCFNNHISEEFAFVNNLDDLQFPKREFKFINSYKNPFAMKTPFTTVLATRGCPHNCIFCTVPILYKRTFRKRSVKNVIKELKMLKEQGIKEIFFRDENITLDKEYMKKLCSEMINNKFNFSWMCNSRVNTIDKETINLMKKSGCHMIKFVVESGDQKILNNIRKGVTIDQIRDAFDLCKKYKIDTVAHFMIGNLEDTKETITKTINFAIELDPLYVSYDLVLKYPGTEIEKIDRLTELTDEELNEFYNLGYKKFYIRPKLILKHIAKLRSPNQIKQKIYGSFNLWRGLFIKKDKETIQNEM